MALAAPSPQASGQDKPLADQVSETQQKIDENKQRNEKLRRQVDELQQRNDTASDELRQRDATIAELRRQLHDVKGGTDAGGDDAGAP